jgi:hypothetical protein
MLNRREFMSYSAGSLLAAGLSLQYSREDEVKLYDLALKNASFRPMCVKTFYNSLRSSVVDQVSYDDNIDFSFGHTNFGTCGENKSNLIFYRPNFNHNKIKILGKEIIVSPSRHVLTTSIVHENYHAEASCYGQDLGDVKINDDNMELYREALRSFVWHAGAYLAEVAYTSDLKKIHADALGAHQLSTAYFYDFVSWSLSILKHERLSSIEEVVLDAQLKKLSLVKPEVEEVLSNATGKSVHLDLDF